MSEQEEIPLSHPATLSDEDLQRLLKTLESAVFEDDYRKELSRPVCLLLVTELIEKRKVQQL